MTELEKAARMALEFCEFCWRDVALNDYALKKLEQTTAALNHALATTERTVDDVLSDIDAATCPECKGLGIIAPGVLDSPDGPGLNEVPCKPCKGTGWRNGVHLSDQQPTTTERKGEPVAWMWQHEETGHKGFVEADQLAMGWEAANPRLKIVAPLYTSPQAPDDVIAILDECRTALIECDRDCDYELIDRAYAAIDAARKEPRQ